MGFCNLGQSPRASAQRSALVQGRVVRQTKHDREDAPRKMAGRVSIFYQRTRKSIILASFRGQKRVGRKGKAKVRSAESGNLGRKALLRKNKRSFVQWDNYVIGTLRPRRGLGQRIGYQQASTCRIYALVIGLEQIKEGYSTSVQLDQ